MSYGGPVAPVPGIPTGSYRDQPGAPPRPAQTTGAQNMANIERRHQYEDRGDPKHVKQEQYWNAFQDWQKPTQGVEDWNQYVWNDPRMKQSFNQYQGALGGMGAAADQYYDQTQNFLNGDMKGFRQDANWRAGQQANQMMRAQERSQVGQMMNNVAQQAAMSSRGGMSPGTARYAISSATGASQQLAGQQTANRFAAVQEARNAAMARYLDAQQSQLKARESGFDARNKWVDAQGAAMDRQSGIMQGTVNAAQNRYGQYHTAAPTYTGEANG